MDAQFFSVSNSIVVERPTKLLERCNRFKQLSRCIISLGESSQRNSKNVLGLLQELARGTYMPCSLSLMLALLFFPSTTKASNEISEEKLIDFLNDRQRDPRLNEILYPHYNSQRVREIIATYEPDQELVKRGQCSKDILVERFEAPST